MRTLKLGKTGVEVSALCLGAMFFGTRTAPQASYRVLDAYTEAGGSFIDTANIYAHWVSSCKGGESETLLGEWMRARGNRSGLFLASKVGFEYPGVERRLTAGLIAHECEKTLQRMGIETLDLYYGHVDDRTTPLDETLEAFDRLVRAGKVRFVGASNYRAWRLEQAGWISRTKGWAEFCCVQQRHTYLPLRPGASTAPQVAANEDLLDYCASSGTTLLAYSVALGGAYSRSDRPLPPEYASPDGDWKRCVPSRAKPERLSTR